MDFYTASHVIPMHAILPLKHILYFVTMDLPENQLCIASLLLTPIPVLYFVHFLTVVQSYCSASSRALSL